MDSQGLKDFQGLDQLSADQRYQLLVDIRQESARRSVQTLLTVFFLDLLEMSYGLWWKPHKTIGNLT